MTDVWCFTCDHELRQDTTGRYIHLDPDDMPGCLCDLSKEECAP